MSEPMTLEPCPFCGMSVEYVTRPVSYGREFWYVYHPEHPRGECILEDQKFSSARGWNRRAHLAQPAQAVDVGEPIAWAWHSDGMKGWALGHVKPTPENTERFHDRNTIVRGLYFDPGALTGDKARPVDGWISVEERRPERNKPAIYWHKSEFGGFAAIADEWRDEHHLAHATHWLQYTAPASPAPNKEGL